METQIDVFVSQWNEKFPGVASPDLRFNGVEDIEQRLSTCKSVIKSLEDRLNQERFHLIFLQVGYALLLVSIEKNLALFFPVFGSLTCWFKSEPATIHLFSKHDFLLKQL